MQMPLEEQIHILNVYIEDLREENDDLRNKIKEALDYIRADSLINGYPERLIEILEW